MWNGAMVPEWHRCPCSFCAAFSHPLLLLCHVTVEWYFSLASLKTVLIKLPDFSTFTPASISKEITTCFFAHSSSIQSQPIAFQSSNLLFKLTIATLYFCLLFFIVPFFKYNSWTITSKASWENFYTNFPSLSAMPHPYDSVSKEEHNLATIWLKNGTLINYGLWIFAVMFSKHL